MSRAKSIGETALKKAKELERDLMNLALLPPEWIPEAFGILQDKLKLHTELCEIMGLLFKYYESFWIRKVKPEIFSVFQKKQRTNNVIERYHRALKELMSTNPEIIQFIGKPVVKIILTVKDLSYLTGKKHFVSRHT